MSYYILPKILNDIAIDIETKKEEELKPFISHSIFNYHNETLNLIEKLCSNETSYIFSNIDELSKIVNAYEYIFTKVRGSKFSVSKIKPFSNTFYDFLEICQTLNIFDLHFEKKILSMHFGENNLSTIECMNMIREYNDDINIGFNEIDEYFHQDALEETNNTHFFFYEYNNKKECNSIISCIKFIITLLKKQKDGGCCIIKIENLFYKPTIDLIYLLSSLYEKLYLIKPNTSKVTSCEKYIICKYFIRNSERINLYLEKLLKFLEKYHDENMNVVCLIKDEIPYYFLNKIEEANIIVGQQQLESLDAIVHILKNKNKEDKVENLKKINLQKCIHWCEKYKIPYNKFSEKTNIFLSFLKSEDEVEHANNNEFENDILNNNNNDYENANVVIEIFNSNEVVS